MNDTIEKFGYPETLLKEYQYWVVLLRPEQLTAGCMVLACKENGEGMSEISSDAYAELPQITGELAAALKRAFGMEKINYLALMMVDRNVHFHVVPRYSEDKPFESVTFTDKGWPTFPELKHVHDVPEKDFQSLKQYILNCW